MSCCACAGSCNHVGNHWFCKAHGGSEDLSYLTSTTGNGTVWDSFRWVERKCPACNNRQPTVAGAAICDPCFTWLNKPWWRRGRRP